MKNLTDEVEAIQAVHMAVRDMPPDTVRRIFDFVLHRLMEADDERQDRAHDAKLDHLISNILDAIHHRQPTQAN